MNMNKLTKLVGTGALALGMLSGCNYMKKGEQAYVQPQQPQAVQVTDDSLTMARAGYIQMREDKQWSREDLTKVIDTYQTLKLSKPDETAPEDVKILYNKIVGEHEKVITDAFNEADISAYVGIVTDNASGNRRGNYGGGKQLYVGKGKDVADQFSIDQKITLLRTSRPAWVPYNAKDDVIGEADVYGTSMPVDRAHFENVLKARKAFGKKNDPASGYLDERVYAALNDGKADFNGEIRDEHFLFSAAYNGHKAD